MNKIKDTYKYKMSRECFKSILGSRKDKEKNMNPYVYAKNYINDEYGLKGTCVEVVVY